MARKILEAEARQIADLRRARDALAAQLGAAVLEHRELERQVQTAVSASLRQEKKIAESAIRALGYDPAAARYRVSPDGTVLVERDGCWTEAE